MNDIANPEMLDGARERRESSWIGSFGSLLRAELSHYPGRPLLVLRIVLACTLVMLSIIVFRIPGGVLGAYYPLLISRDNLHATRRSAIWIAGTCTLGTVEVVSGAMLFVGAPTLHLIWVWASLLAVFYLVSTLKVYEAALALGLFITNTITIWDQPVSADLRLRQTLFTLLAILIGCAASVLVEHLLSRTHPADAVIEGIEERLKLTRRVLQCVINNAPERFKVFHEVRRRSAQGTAILRSFVAQADYSFEEQQRLSTAVALAGRLIDLAASLVETRETLSSTDLDLCTAISKNLSGLSGNLLRKETPEWIDVDGRYETSIPTLIEIERTVDLLAESLSRSMWDGVDTTSNLRVAEPSSKIFVDDAFTNGIHPKFAARGALSAIACYMFYMSVGWVGLGASVATCILTALPITGAARHKQLTRFAGVVLGACVLGFAAQIAILPQIDSILSYTLLFASATFLGAWIGTSGPRISYCGVQVVLAYELVNLNRFSFNPSLVPARDTVLGIVVGVGAMWLIFDHLWATSSTDTLRPLLSATIREIAQLPVESMTLNPSTEEALLEKRTSAIMRNFEKLRSLVDVSLFEAFPKATQDELLLQRATDYLPQLRVALLIKTGLSHHRIVSGNRCQSKIAAQVQERCSEVLEEVALNIDKPSTDSPSTSSEADKQINEMLISDADPIRKDPLECDLTELRLCSSLFNVVHHLRSVR